MQKLGFFGICLLATQVFATPETLLDGKWCTPGTGGDLWQWGDDESANVLEKDQFCLLLKVSKTDKGDAVGRAITQFVQQNNTPSNASTHLKSGVFSDRAVFAFSSHHGNRLRMSDTTDTSVFDLTLEPEDTLHGFVTETGGMRKSLTGKAFASHLYFVKSGPLPDNFETLWTETQPADQ
jgi:hypothetical protein